MTAYDAVVLAGGAARRLGGADKMGLDFEGSSSLDRVLDALEGAEHVVAVGPARPTRRHVLWALEETPGSGPACALRAGVSRVDNDVVVVLAGDLPLIDRATVERLVEAVEGHDGAVLVDAEGRQQLLAGAYRRDRLEDALRGMPVNASVTRGVGRLDLAEVPDERRVALDCDTWDDVEKARSRL